MPIDREAHLVATPEHLHGVPLAARFFDFVWPAESFLISPWVAAGPVEPCAARSFGHPLHRDICAVDNQHVAGAALDNLRFDGFGPDLVFADAVHKDSAVAGVGESWK